MPKGHKLAPAVDDQVRRRAAQLCEYCHASERWQYVKFTFDHVVPLSRGGTDSVDNLALACFHCNRRKSDKTSARAEGSDEDVPLFNPRRQAWSEHFAWSADGLLVVGHPGPSGWAGAGA